MAFATSQSIDQLLTRGLAFRLPNNAPISSLYTLYANGAGMTYWSNSMNPRDLSTVSSACGSAIASLSNTVAFQQGEIDDLYGQISTLSTSISSLSNWVFDYTNSTIAGLSTFSTFYNDLYSLSTQTGIALNGQSTLIGVTNSTQTVFLTSTLTSSMNGLVLSTSGGLSRQISSISSSVTYNTAFYSTTRALNGIILSTSAGLNSYINATSSAVNTVNARTTLSTISTTTNMFSTIQGYGPRIGRLETLSTNQSTFTGVWISSQVGVSQSTQNFQLISSLRNLSSLISTVAVTAVGQANQISSLSTVLFGSISTNNAINASQDAAISSLSRNLSILTTSSILAGVYDTFIQLEEYTVNLINSTVNSMNYWQSSLYASTIIQTQAIGSAYFSTFNATTYFSSVSAVTVVANAFASTYSAQLFSTSLTTANSQTSTSIGTLYSTSYTSIVNLNSTQISLLYSTGSAFLISTLNDTNTLRSTTVAIGSNAGVSSQGAFGVALGFNAGRNIQGAGAVALGYQAGNVNQGTNAIAIGYQAATSNQTSNTIVLNASGTALETGIAAGFYVAPVRNDETVTTGFVHYDTTTKELVYNSVGGGGGGGSSSTFNDILYSTSRGLQVSAVNANSVETAKTNMYDTSYFGNTITLVSTLNGGDPELEGRWAPGPVAMSADGKYQLFGTGINNSPQPYFPYFSSNYGESYNSITSVGGCNWNGFAMSRSGQYMYMACGGNGVDLGTLFKSADFGNTWGSLNSISANIWGPLACSGDGRYIMATSAILPIGKIFVSNNFGESFTQQHENNYYAATSMSITGQYMTVSKAAFATGVSISSDFGQTWSNVTGTGDDQGFGSLAMSADGRYQVAGHSDNGTLYASSNYGSNWSLTPSTSLLGTVYSLNMDNSGQYVTAAVFNNSVPSLGGILFSSNYGASYQVLTTGLNFLGSGLSPNAQYATFLARPSIYRSYIPTRFGAGLSATNYSPSTNTAYLVNSNAGTVPQANADTWNSVVGLGIAPARTWEIGLQTNGAPYSLGFLSYNTNNFSGTRTLIGYIDPSLSSNTPMNFTGQHRCFPADDSFYPLTSNIGKVVVTTGTYQSMPLNGSLVRGISSITITESLPLISLARNAKDKRCFGVVCDVEDFDARTSESGNFVTPYPKVPGDTRIFVNSLGEGAIWVCDVNGPVENGDYLTTSDVPGYAMKQGEEYIANYTVAKATMSCDFAEIYLPAQIPLTSTINGQTTYVLDQYSTVMWTVGSNMEPLYQVRYVDMYGYTITKEMYEATLANGGVAHRAAFLGCTYHCG